MAAGVPVVASDLPAIRETTAGLTRLVTPGDPDALAAALHTELRCPTPPAALAAAARHALSHTWTRCAQLTAAAYATAAAAR